MKRAVLVGSTMIQIEVNRDYVYPRTIMVLKQKLDKILGETGVDRAFLITEPPSHIKSDLAYPIMREIKRKQLKIETVLKEINDIKNELKHIENIEVRSGFLNIYYNKTEFTRIFFNEYLRQRKNYSKNILSKKLKIVVEHTSANPVHPLHIGHARNSSLGDTLARLFKQLGAIVETRFYIDDVGRQTSILVYGLTKLGSSKKDWERYMGKTKPDHWIGLVYAMTNILIELNKLKKNLEAKKDTEEYSYLINKQDELVSEAALLRGKQSQLFDTLAEQIMNDPDPEKTVSGISLKYEKGEEPYRSLVREAVEISLEGFRETLSSLNVEFDKWDWESDIVWEGLVSELLDKARKTPYFTTYKEAEALDFSSLLSSPEIRQKLRIPKEMDIPPLILRRSDGTTLYTTRDIGYSIKKFEETDADYVINVVGKEQTLPQAQVRLALYALGYKGYAVRLIHYGYEMVSLPGVKMSGRRGRYITLDEVIKALEQRAEEEVLKRNMPYSQDERKMIAKIVGRGAARYFLVSVAADKPLVMKYEEIINFEKNTAPYIQYAHARASSILRNAGSYSMPESFEWVEEKEERYHLVKTLSKYPWVITKAGRELKPELIVSYLGELTQLFNKWYTRDPVLNDTVKDRRNFKLLLVESVKNIISSGLWILGVEAPERM